MKVNCLRFWMRALTGWCWHRTTTLALVLRKCWFQANQPRSFGNGRKCRICCAQNCDPPHRTASGFLPFSPLQLGAQHMKKISSGAKQIHLMLGATAVHAVAVAQVEAGLTIKAQVRDFLFAPQHD